MEYKFDNTNFLNAVKVNLEQLQTEIKSAINVNIINVALEAFSDSIFNVVITFDTALSEAEEEVLGVIIENYTYQGYQDTVALLKDVKPPGTNGGTFQSNTWIMRELNTLIGDVNFVILDNSQFTITEGTYNVRVSAPACNVQNHQIKLYNSTTSSDIEYGTSEFAASEVISNSTLNTILKLTESNTFEIQHICYKTVNNIGLGKATGFAINEVYCSVFIQKLL
jgi:hypothetical protein